MEERPTVILIGASQAREAIVKQALKDLADLRIESNVLVGVSASRKAGARVALIDLASDVELSLRMMQDLTRAAPEIQLIALASEKDPDLILKAVRSGAREYVVLDDRGELQRVFAEMTAKAPVEEQAGTIICLFPSKGGIGSTALATNVGGMLLAGGKQVVIVDLDLQLGDVLVFLDMASRYTIADVLHNMKRLDKELLISSVAKHSSGVHVLAQSDHLEEADKVSAVLIGPLLRFLARFFDFVIVDGLRGFDEKSLAALDAANRILLLIGQDVPSIKNGQRSLDVFHRLCYDAEKVQLIVNRYQKSEKIDLHAIEDNLGVRVNGVVVNDYATVSRAVNRGVMLSDIAPKAKVTEDIRAVASLVGGPRLERQEGGGGGGGGFLRSLFGRRSEDRMAERPLRAAKKESEEGDEPKRAPEAV